MRAFLILVALAAGWPGASAQATDSARFAALARLTPHLEDLPAARRAEADSLCARSDAGKEGFRGGVFGGLIGSTMPVWRRRTP